MTSLFRKKPKDGPTGKDVYEHLKKTIGSDSNYEKLWNYVKSCGAQGIDKGLYERYQNAPDIFFDSMNTELEKKMLIYMGEHPDEWSSPVAVKEMLDRILSRYIQSLRDHGDYAASFVYYKYVREGTLGNPLERLIFELKSKFEQHGHYNLETEYTKHKNRELLKGIKKLDDPKLTEEDKAAFAKYLEEFNSEIKQWLESYKKKEKLKNVFYYKYTHPWFTLDFEDQTQKDWYFHFFRAIINWQHYKLIHEHFNEKEKNIDQDKTNWLTFKWHIQENWDEISAKIREAKIDYPLFYRVWKRIPQKGSRAVASSHGDQDNYMYEDYNHYVDNQDSQSMYLSDHNDDMVYSPQSQFEYQYGLVLNQPYHYNDNESSFDAEYSYLLLYIGFIFIVIAICLCLFVLVSIIGYLLGLNDRKNNRYSAKGNKYISMKYYEPV